MTTLRKALDLAYDAAGYLAAFFVLAIFVLMIAQTVLRETGFRSGGMDDLVAWSCAASAFLAMAHTFRYGDFVRVTLLIEPLNPRVRRIQEIGALAIAAAFSGYLAWWAVKYVHESWLYKDMSQGLIVVYRGTGVLNFSLGATAIAGVFLQWELQYNHGWPFLAAGVAGVAFFVGVFVIVWAVRLPEYQEIGALGLPFLALAFIAFRLARNVAAGSPKAAVQKS